MAVPDFQSLMLPLLRLAADGQEHRLADARTMLAAEFKLTDADREELLPSGRQSKFANRVAWAKVYLAQAGLLLSPRRGHFQISDRGRELLKAPPARIDIKFLQQYPEFLEFRTPKLDGEVARRGQPADEPEPETPEETLEAAQLKMRASLATEILTRIKAGTSDFFEHLVVELLLKMGYGGSRGTPVRLSGRPVMKGLTASSARTALGSTSSTFRRKNGRVLSDGLRSRSSWAPYTASVRGRGYSSQLAPFLVMRLPMLSTSNPRSF